MPDATGLELIAQELREIDPGTVIDTVFFREQATLLIDPAQVKPVIRHLIDAGYSFLASLHGCDYYPEEPRLGVLYVLLDMKRVDRITVKARVSTDPADRIQSSISSRARTSPSARSTTCSASCSRATPTCAGS